MAVEVDIRYNPFLPRLTVLIDGKQPSEYSRLTQFADEDIWNWHSEILNIIYAEVRNDFYIIFVGNLLDGEIIKRECQKNPHCINFYMEMPTVCMTLQKRLGKLNQFIKNNNVINFKKTCLIAKFVISPELQEYSKSIQSLDINNLFCETQIRIINKNDDFDDKKNVFLFILTKNILDGERIVQKYHSQNPIFILCQGEKTKIAQISFSYIVYEYAINNINSAIFECFLSFPLTQAFRSCVKSISDEKLNMQELLKITAMDPIVQIKIEKNIEVGKSKEIQMCVDPPNVSLPRIIFKIIDDTIAKTDNIHVFGVQPGKTQLEAYYYGTQKPFEICEINVIKRNRIQTIILSEDELILGVGNKKRLDYEYSPIDADNVDKVIWKSSNDTIATVDLHGRVTAKSCGNCKIWCIAENVSAACNCEVRPYLEKIRVEFSDKGKDGRLYLKPMEEYKLNINVYPENSIDREYRIISSDYNIANIVGEKIIAKNIGTAMIEIENTSRRKKISFEVKVSKSKSKFLKKLFQK